MSFLSIIPSALLSPHWVMWIPFSEMPNILFFGLTARNAGS